MEMIEIFKNMALICEILVADTTNQTWFSSSIKKLKFFKGGLGVRGAKGPWPKTHFTLINYSSWCNTYDQKINQNNHLKNY